MYFSARLPLQHCICGSLIYSFQFTARGKEKDPEKERKKLMALVGEALLSASVQVLVDRIVSTDFKNFYCSKGYDTSILNKLKMTLLTLRAVLNDAEEKQITNPAVQDWLFDLKDAVFDADNLLDDINTRALTRKIEAESQSFSYKVWNLLSSPFKRLRGGTNSELEELLEKLEYFAKQKDILGLKEGVSKSVWYGKAATSVVGESTIYGRDDDVDKLKKYLISEDACDDHVGVITIVGMGGLGKTTLTQLLYNDKEVKGYFNLKSWAYITKEFDVFRVTKTLLESVSSKPVVTNNLDALQVELQQSLSGKKFLFVLDDLWDTYNDWNRLKAILKSGDAGSRVIVTTRQENVALAMNTFPIYYLRPLSHQHCWDLLAEHAFGTNQSNRDPKLEVIGRKIADKCGGLPLAAEALGGLLRTKLSEKDWNKILKSNIWDLPDNKVLPPLLLSYHYLPAALKGCFAYCSIFPKHHAFDKEMVVRLWMAEGFIQFKNNRSLEETGDEYFDELVSRSLLQRNSKFKFTMHDLINDLATAVSAGYYFRYEDPKPSECLDRVRHLSYGRGTYDYRSKFDVISGIKGLRTFVALSLRENSYQHYLAESVPNDMVPKMRYLRVLSLSRYDNITKLPDSLGNLIHLRYLDLSYTKIKRLPDGTCKLCNLQTLLLSHCKSLIELPRDIDKLINLRHIDLTGTKLREMPANLSRLKNLKTLTSFVVSKKEDGLKVRDLGNFLQLQGKLSILNLQHVADANEAFQVNLKNKDQIKELAFEWGRYYTKTKNPVTEREVLDRLQPSTDMKKLSIKYYCGTIFPNWLGNSSFCNMVYLWISDCDHCWSLPPLGQLPALKQLSIARLKSLKSIGVGFYGGGEGSSSFQPFPCLGYLSFIGLSHWEEWLFLEDVATEFPSLEYLGICDCPKLRGNLPNNLPSLYTLTIDGCHVLESDSEIPLKKWSSSSRDLKWISSLQSLHVIHSPGVLSLLETLSLPLPLLDYFYVGYHDSLQLFPRITIESNSLRTLYISSIPSLVSFRQEGLPTSLIRLRIQNCEKLQFLPIKTMQNCSSLIHLTLTDTCHSLDSFPLGSFPVLERLCLDKCPNLKSFYIDSSAQSQSLSHLKAFHITNCPNLCSFPKGGLHTPNLEKFYCKKCESLESLPERINTLSGLQELSLHELPLLESFAEEGFPFNLRRLEVIRCEKLSAVSVAQWRSQWLSSLTELTIGGDDLVDALMKMLLLPTSLVSLCIQDVSFLDGKGLQHLTSLENLKIMKCPNLEFLPEKELLPVSLSVLSIRDCPVLQDTHRSNRGMNWPKISHIPWPFNTWGMDILSLFPPAPGQLKFLLVVIDYFTKWIEFEPIAKDHCKPSHEIHLEERHI